MAGIVIIGGGVIGLSVAYHLARREMEEVVVLERNQLTSGTSWHAAGIVGPLRATPNMTQLAMYANRLFPDLEREMGMATGYKRTGGYWLARKPERMDELNRIAALGRHFGLNTKILDPTELAKQTPYLDLRQHVGALHVHEDAHVNPVDLCMAYAKGAKNGGVELREGCEVARIVTHAHRVTGVRLISGEHIHASKVVLCAGAWSKPLARDAGLALPLQAVEHMYVVTEPLPQLPDPFPVLRDLDRGIYIKGDSGGKLIIGGFEANAKCWDAFGVEGNRAFLELPEDWDQFSPFMEAALALLPDLETAGIQRFMNGPESFTADTRPLIGQAPQVDGLFVAAGLNSVGIMSSAGIGKVLSDWIIDGHPPMDLWEVDVSRADPRAANDGHLRARMEEAVADQFNLHWPYKQPTAGRGLRTSILHDLWRDQGAVFGITGGWERGLWYARTPQERVLPYCVGAQAWYPIVQREAAQMEEGTVLIDLAPFAKFDVSGPDAPAWIEYFTCRNADIDIGRVLYAPVLNNEGGIEADVTITRLAENRFRIFSGAATRWRDAALIRRTVSGLSVNVEDRTEQLVVLGVMGAGARNLLAALADEDWHAFPFATSRPATVADVGVQATRISYVGELGWELTIDLGAAASVFSALIQAGAKPMGHYALDACRIEKGYYHWGHDIGPTITPLEAGLDWAIDWQTEFRGKSALIKQRSEGVTRRVRLLELTGEALVLHDEPIWENGRVVGLTTSGARGARSAKTLAFGLIEITPGETHAETCHRDFQIEIAGKFYPARALAEAPFDPSGGRMRA